MSKVRPTNPLDQLDLGFGSAEDLKPKKQTPLKTGPSPFDGKLEKAVTEREAQRVLRSMQAEKATEAVSKAEAEKHQKALREYVSGQRSAASLAGIGSDSPMKVIKKPYKAGGKVKAPSASKRADGIAQRGKTRGRMV
jgi:regulator of protease activity HflC (stomatin/prohibitin superfamily)